jgi:copper resistance protein C
LKASSSGLRARSRSTLQSAWSRSTIRVNDEHGAQVDRQDSHVDPSNPLLLRATLQLLEHGAYSVIWRVLSVDGKVTEGRFTIRVE